MSDLTLIIPAKNEKESLPKVLDELKGFDFKKNVILEASDRLTIEAVKTYDCKIYEAKWTLYENSLIFRIKADRFLRNMVRAIVGTLIEIGLEKITEKYWDDRMAINLKHYLFAIQAVKKSMIKNKGGSIINLGSVSWVRGAVMFPAYSTAKAGIHGLTRSLARDLGKYNIRINSIAPGSIATARQSKLWLNPKFKKEILKNQALKKQLLPEDVSRMVLYLASDVSSGSTKQNFTVDAGLI